MENMTETRATPFAVDSFRPQRTDELQAAYNSWRDAEASSRFEAGLQVRREARAKAGPLYTSGSSNHRVADSVDAGDSQVETPRSLDECRRLRTVFFLAVGTCEGCREVHECPHLVLDHFEAVYQDGRTHKPAPATTRLCETDLLGMGPPLPDVRLPEIELLQFSGGDERLTVTVTPGHPRMSNGSADWDASVLGPMFGYVCDVDSCVVLGDDGAGLGQFLERFDLTWSGPVRRQGQSAYNGLQPGIGPNPFGDTWQQAWAKVQAETENHGQAAGPWQGTLSELMSVVFVLAAGWAVYEQCPPCVEYAIMASAAMVTILGLTFGAGLAVQREREEEEPLLLGLREQGWDGEDESEDDEMDELV